MEKLIKVTGKGKLSVKPDLIRLLINLEDKRETYEETLAQSTAQVEMLKDCFEKLGFDRTASQTMELYDVGKKEFYTFTNLQGSQTLLLKFLPHLQFYTFTNLQGSQTVMVFGPLYKRFYTFTNLQGSQT